MTILLAVWGWLKRAWAWLKRDWHWLMVLTAGLGALLLIKKKPRVEVVSTELSGADQVKRDLEAKKLGEEAKLQGKRDDSVQDAGQKRDDAVGDLIDRQKEVADDPPQGDDLTDYLKSAGKDVRR